VDAEWVTRRPAPALAALIEGYHGYRMHGFAAGVHRGLPSRHVTFIVSVGTPIDVVAQTDPSQSPRDYRCVISGLQASPALIAHDGNQEGVAIELTPVGFRTLFAMPARALWNTSVELDDVVGPIGTELWERLQGTDRWDERFAACDDVLTRIARAQTVSPELRRSWELLVASRGAVAVGDLADDVGWSRQHLTRRFTDEFGLGPKLAGRVIRFERARRMLQSVPAHITIAQVAATCGYYDQAHLTNEFAELAGCTPTQLLLEEALPSFQDDDADVRG
jgi:AraC-like DNA-binding protein